MANNLKAEMAELSKYDNIKEKLRIMSVYSDFYCGVLSFTKNEEQMKYNIEYLQLTFKLVCNIIAVNKKEVGLNEFMLIYLNFYQMNPSVLTKPVLVCIKTFEENLTKKLDTEYIDLIDSYDNINFEEKTDILLTFMAYLSGVFNRMYDIYGLDEYVKFKRVIPKILTPELKDYLDESLYDDNLSIDDILDELRDKMTMALKNRLMDVIIKDYTAFNEFNDESINFVYNKLTTNEKKIWLLSTVYNIAGLFADNSLNNHEVGELMVEDIDLILDLPHDEIEEFYEKFQNKLAREYMKLSVGLLNDDVAQVFDELMDHGVDIDEILDNFNKYLDDDDRDDGSDLSR